MALPNKDDIETNFDFGNRCRFNLNCATVILFLRANLHGKEVTTTNYLFSQKYSLGGGEKGGIGAVHKQRRQLGGRKGKNGQNCRRTKKTTNMGEGGDKNMEKMPTSSMDGPISVQKTLVDCIVLRRTSFVWESHQVFQ